MEASTPSRRIHFGKFEVDLESSELFKDGRPVRLQGQPIQILVMLLEKPGRIVTREELQQRLWPGDTFVDFDHSLNAAIQRLREALSDSAEEPRFIETLPRRGYRFIFPIEAPHEEAKDGSGAGEENAKREKGERRKHHRQKALWVALVIAIVLGIGISGWLFYSRRSVMPTLKVRRFTSFRGVETSPAFSPDGNQVAFCWNGEKQDNWDIYVQLIDGGKPLRLTTNPADDLDPAWSRDGRRIAFNRCAGVDCEILIIPAIGGAEQSLGMNKANMSGKMSWSPDGKFLAITEYSPPENTSRICLIFMETGERQRLTSSSGGTWDYTPMFSPDGQTLAFVRATPGKRVLNVLSLVDGKPKGDARSLTIDSPQFGDFDWMPDGRSLIFSSDRAGLYSWNLWKIAATGGEPSPLAGVSGDAAALSVARQSDRLIYESFANNLDIYQFSGLDDDRQHPSKNELQPIALIASTLWEMDPQFSRDGKKIVYSTFTEIWTCNADGTNGNQLTNFQLMEKGSQCGSPRWSPDGNRIAFDHINNGKIGIYVVSAKGGLCRCVTSESLRAFLPSWSRDGRWIYFASNQTGDSQVWKVPSGGGPAVQVTRHGGWEAFESVDGQWLYYTKDHRFRGVWRVPVGGGEESQVLNQGRGQNWAIVASGIYLSEDEPSGVPAIFFYSFSTHRLERLFTMPKRLIIPRGFTGNLAVSPDGHSILIVAHEPVESDLVLVENFR